MANNLIQSGHRLVVFDLVESAMQDAVGAGAQRAGSPAEVRGERLAFCFVPSEFMLVTFRQPHSQVTQLALLVYWECDHAERCFVFIWKAVIVASFPGPAQLSDGSCAWRAWE